MPPKPRPMAPQGQIKPKLQNLNQTFSPQGPVQQKITGIGNRIDKRMDALHNLLGQMGGRGYAAPQPNRVVHRKTDPPIPQPADTSGGQFGPEQFNTYAPPINPEQFKEPDFLKKGLKGSNPNTLGGGFGSFGSFGSPFSSGGMDPMMMMQFMQMFPMLMEQMGGGPISGR